MANTVKQVTQESQLDQFGLETVGGTSSSQFGMQTTFSSTSLRSNATLMAANGNIFSALSGAAGGLSYAVTTGSEITVVSFSIPAKTLDIAGRGIQVTAWGSATFASGTCVGKMYFGSVGTTLGTLSTTNAWAATLTVYKSAANVQSGFFESAVNTTHQGSTTLLQTETDTSAIVVKLTANNSAVANALICNGFIITAFN